MDQRVLIPAGTGAEHPRALSDGGVRDAGDGQTGVDGDGSQVPAGGASCVSCVLTPIGSPTWQPTSAVMLANPGPNGGVPLALQNAFAPNHVWHAAEGLFGPGQPHTGDYGAEVVNLLDAALLPASQSVRPVDAQTPDVLLVVTLVPGPSSAMGGSSDFSYGRIVANVTFPIQASSDILRPAADAAKGKILLSAHQDLSIPDYADLGSSSDQGASHVLVVFDQDGAAIPGSIIGPSTYTWRVILLDANGAGWELQVPFQVNG